MASNSGGVFINSNFDSGNIDVVDMADSSNIQLLIHADPFCETDGRAHFQWFYFRVTGAKGTPLAMNISNASAASYPEGWRGYQACFSYDRRNWFRVSGSEYDADAGTFTIRHTPQHDAVFYAYFAPYTFDKHMQLVTQTQLSERVSLENLGSTLDGHDLDLLVLGDGAPAKKKIWVIARQHPGETMAEWFVEGLLQRLTDRHDSVSRDLLDKATLYVIPNMNPDGSWRGHLRTNAHGRNLNREWAAPSLADSPEVFHTLRKMRETGVDMLVDVHGDEVLPHNFIAYSEGIPGWTEHMARCKASFGEFLERANPDFQTRVGYEIDQPGTANMGVACNAIAQEFDCFAFTLEQPFKDCADHPDEECGWNPLRAKRFGASFVTAIRQIVPEL